MKVLENEPMSKHTSFRIGGKAEKFIEADNIDDVKNILKEIKEKNIPLFVLGNGTNLLVSDKGISRNCFKTGL